MSALTVLWSLVRSKFFWIALGAFGIFGLGFYANYSIFGPDQTDQSLYVAPLDTVPVDELLTAHLYLPILKVKQNEGILYFLGLSDMPDEDIKGYCLREYEVAVGYSYIKYMIHNTDIMKEVCNSPDSEDYKYVPEPVIQKLYSVSSSTQGDFARRDCDKFDLEPSAKKYQPAGKIPVSMIKGIEAGPSESIQQRQSLVILSEMMNSDYKEFWVATKTKSQKILKGYLSMFCHTKEVQEKIQ